MMGFAKDGLIKDFRADRLVVKIYATREQMGQAAAAAVAGEMLRLIAAYGRAVGIFASAPSQNEFLAALVENSDIDWTRVMGFHLDEYLGMNDQTPQSFRRFLIDRLVSKVSMGQFFGLPGESSDPERECSLYAALLESNPPDFAVLGIGENGHLAFIDPPFCDFNDPLAVKIVELDDVCRAQQVHDGAFSSLEDVPRRALSLTIPTIMKCPRIFAIVPGEAKQQAILKTIEGPIESACPASILRHHPAAHLFLDRHSAGSLSQ
jgi:glucosamine-6-phosphate deaminase